MFCQPPPTGKLSGPPKFFGSDFGSHSFGTDVRRISRAFPPIALTGSSTRVGSVNCSFAVLNVCKGLVITSAKNFTGAVTPPCILAPSLLRLAVGTRKPPSPGTEPKGIVKSTELAGCCAPKRLISPPNISCPESSRSTAPKVAKYGIVSAIDSPT